MGMGKGLIDRVVPKSVVVLFCGSFFVDSRTQKRGFSMRICSWSVMLC